jgi:F-type H+-transporting ATPase subunit gamma
VARHEPVIHRLLPIEVPDTVEKMAAGFAFEPSPEAVLDEVLPHLLALALYQAVLEGQASEHSARMMAMRNATDAASDLVDELTLSLNKARQSDITGELLDIAGGAEALRQAMAR